MGSLFVSVVIICNSDIMEETKTCKCYGACSDREREDAFEETNQYPRMVLSY